MCRSLSRGTAAHTTRYGLCVVWGLLGRCYDGKHEIIDEGADDLVMLWFITPPGLEDFFRAVGRPPRPGEPAPALESALQCRGRVGP